MRKIIIGWIWIPVVILLISGCSEAQQAHKEPVPTPVISSEPQILASTNPAMDDPGAVKTFLSAQKIPNGDIYLQDNKVHINIVGLNSEIEQSLAQTFTAGTYELHDVKYTMQELLAAQELLHEQDLYQKLNLYGSGVDTIGNKVTITIPSDDAEAAKLEIEKWIDPKMLTYDISEIGDPHVVGTIVDIDTKQAKRILILEPGNEDPSYWFTFNAKSEMFNEAGETISFKDLQVGQQVKLWNTGMVLESFPALASVRRMELAITE
ncbi:MULTISPECIES: hypothetical protein [unclassified Paenibacillus]|uniref:hypothetical protein n=1 Tax=unclassified Paenibacillus TaxID=185978 RepID=UPI0030F984E1